MTLHDKIALLSREAKAVLFVLGTAEELASRGVLSGPNFLPLSVDGRAAFVQLRNDGFRPTDQEIRDVGQNPDLFVPGPVGVA
jgi:hypothetical protein